jgi:hypothetical protein
MSSNVFSQELDRLSKIAKLYAKTCITQIVFLSHIYTKKLFMRYTGGAISPKVFEINSAILGTFGDMGIEIII